MNELGRLCPATLMDLTEWGCDEHSAKGQLDYGASRNEFCLIQKVTEPCLVVYLVQFLRLRCYCLSAQPVFRKIALLLSARRSNFRSIFFCWHLSEGRQLQEIPIYKVRALINYMIFLRVLQSFPCASDRRFPRAVWRKTRQKWFPWISSQNKIICFSYRCGQYRDSELWEFWTVSQSDLSKTCKNQTKKNQIL